MPRHDKHRKRDRSVSEGGDAEAEEAARKGSSDDDDESSRRHHKKSKHRSSGAAPRSRLTKLEPIDVTAALAANRIGAAPGSTSAGPPPPYAGGPHAVGSSSDDAAQKGAEAASGTQATTAAPAPTEPLLVGGLEPPPPTVPILTGGLQPPTAFMPLLLPASLMLVPPPAPPPLVAPSSTSGALTLVNTSVSLMPPSANASKKQSCVQAARESRRVHLSNLPRGVTADFLKPRVLAWCDELRREAINEQLTSQGKDPLPQSTLLDIDSILDVFINPGQHGSPFAFIELGNDDMATLLIEQAEKGRFELKVGEKVRIRRPNNYKAMTGTDAKKIMALGIQNPEEKENEEMLKDLFSTFGEVLVFAIIPSRGCYVEYKKASAARQAVATLHGEIMADYALSVQLATECMRIMLATSFNIPVTGIDWEVKEDPAEQAADVVKSFLNMGVNLSQGLYNYVQLVPHLLEYWPTIAPTRILILMNMVDTLDLESDKAYSELCSVVFDEVEKYGRVKNVIIPREPPPPPLPPQEVPLPVRPTAPPYPDEATVTAHNTALEQWEVEFREAEAKNRTVVEEFHAARLDWERLFFHPVRGQVAMGRIFVEYESVDEAAEAQRAISGRLFNGRTVITSFLFEDILYPPTAEEEAKELAVGLIEAAAKAEAELAKNADSDDDAAAGTADID